MRHEPPTTCELRLTWIGSRNSSTFYSLWALDTADQLRWVADFEQGPFDTALDVAQWAWRAIAREVTPSAC